VLTESFVLDVYRVSGERPHQYDWAVHAVGAVEMAKEAEAFDLGSARGYRHFNEARRCAGSNDGTRLEWVCAGGVTRAQIVPPPGGVVLVARGPALEEAHRGLAELGLLEARTTVIVRVRGSAALFLSLWTFEQQVRAELRLLEGSARQDVVVETRLGTETARWRVPWRGEPVRREPEA
jgi:hypothetical protein